MFAGSQAVDKTEKQVEKTLRAWIEPHLGCDLYTANAVRSLSVKDGKIAIDLCLGFAAQSLTQSLSNQIRHLVTGQTGISDVTVQITWEIQSHVVQPSLKPLQGIKNILAVASGKGGVGKSTIAANLAVALAAEGAKVGMLDADIYGPSQPRMLDMHDQPEMLDGNKLQPLSNYGVTLMSIGLLIDEESPMVWRGPMLSQTLQQLMTDTTWGELDYLVVDLPPGTGDAQLTLAQRIPVSGAIIVTTPQDIALLDARRGLRMFEKVEVPVLGIVENMSTHICPNCGFSEDLFGHGGGAEMAKQYGIDLLGSLPLHRQIREQTDNGTPTVHASSDSELGQQFRDMALNAAAQLSLRAIEPMRKFPQINIDIKTN